MIFNLANLLPFAQKILTETWLYNEGLADQISSFSDEIFDYIRSESYFIPSTSELVLELVETGDRYLCDYYFADHATRSVFWLEPVNVSEWLGEVTGEIAPEHAREIFSPQK